MKLPLKRLCLEDIKPYVPGKPIDEVKRELGLDDVIKLASNENPLGASPLALKAIQDALPEINYYPDGNCFYLREGLAAKLDVEGDQLIFGNGSDELIKLLAETYINPGDEVIMPRPSFSEYEFAVNIMGGSMKYASLTEDFRYDMQVYHDLVTEKTRMIFLCSPNNPTGTIVTRKALEQFLDRLPDGIVVVMDEAYYEYTDDPEYPESLAYIRQGLPFIALRTFSKLYGLAGLRIGYGMAPAALIQDLSRVREPFNVNHLAQVAARVALTDQAHFERSRNLVIESRQTVAAGLREMGLDYVPSQANFYFINTGIDSRQLFEYMMKRGVIVRTGDIFGFPTYIRVSFGTPEENKRFLIVLRTALSELVAR